MNTHHRPNDDDNDEILGVFYDAGGAAKGELRGIAAAILRPGETRRDGVRFRDEHVADVVQDAYLAVAAMRERGAAIENLDGYARRVVQNKAHDVERAVSDGERWQSSLDAPASGTSDAARVEALGERTRSHGSACDPFEQAASSDGVEWLLRRAHAALADQKRALHAFQTLVACDADAAWALDEIQATTGCGRGAAKMRLQQARDAIRATFAP